MYSVLCASQTKPLRSGIVEAPGTRKLAQPTTSDRSVGCASATAAVSSCSTWLGPRTAPVAGTPPPLDDEFRWPLLPLPPLQDIDGWRRISAGWVGVDGQLGG